MAQMVRAHTVPHTRVPPCTRTNTWVIKLGCHGGHPEVSRCCNKGESENSIAHRHVNKGCSLALKSRADITRIPK